MTIRLPDKLYFKIGEVARLAQVPPHVLRYWESEFSAIKPKRTSARQRLYRKQDVELILRIKTLLHQQGFTIAGARKLLQTGLDVELTTADHGQPGGKVTNRLQNLKKELKELQALLDDKQKDDE